MKYYRTHDLFQTTNNPIVCAMIGNGEIIHFYKDLTFGKSKNLDMNYQYDECTESDFNAELSWLEYLKGA